MKRRVVSYTEDAAVDLDWIYDAVAEASGSIVTASRYEQRIRAFCDNLDLASERSQRRDDIRPGLRVVGFERRVSIAFDVGEESVTVLRIFYGGADWERAL